MENLNWFDILAGGLALAIVIGGLSMLLQGMFAFGRKK